MASFKVSLAFLSVGFALLGNLLISSCSSLGLSCFCSLWMQSLKLAQSLSHLHPLLLCILLNSALQYLFFHRRCSCSTALQIAASAHHCDSSSKLFLVKHLKDLHCFVVGSLDGSATANPEDEADSSICSANSVINVEEEEDMSLDELHLRIESFISRVRRNMWVELKDAERTSSKPVYDMQAHLSSRDALSSLHNAHVCSSVYTDARFAAPALHLLASKLREEQFHCTAL